MGRRLAEARQAAGITQRELAQAVGVTDQTISNIERGASRPDLETALSIARYFGRPVESLFAPSESTDNVDGEVALKNGSPARSGASAPSLASTSGDVTGSGDGAAK